jgi:hypothetical protein
VELRLWPKQQEALLSPANENLYGGAAGGGKSHLLRAASIIYSIWVPGLITYIFRRTFKELVSNHIHTPGGYPEMLRDFLKNKKVRWDKSNSSGRADWLPGHRRGNALYGGNGEVHQIPRKTGWSGGSGAV